MGDDTRTHKCGRLSSGGKFKITVPKAAMTTDKPSLLPCPFCGSQPELMEGHRNHWRVECPKCGVRRAQFANGGVSEDQARAIAAWNTRTAEPQQGLVERVDDTVFVEIADPRKIAGYSNNGTPMYGVKRSQIFAAMTQDNAND